MLFFALTMLLVWLIEGITWNILWIILPTVAFLVPQLWCCFKPGTAKKRLIPVYVLGADAVLLAIVAFYTGVVSGGWDILYAIIYLYYFAAECLGELLAWMIYAVCRVVRK